MIEVGNLLTEDKILQKLRTTRTNRQRILIVRNDNALIRGQFVIRSSRLMQFTASANGRLTTSLLFLGH